MTCSLQRSFLSTQLWSRRFRPRSTPACERFGKTIRLAGPAAYEVPSKRCRTDKVLKVWCSQPSAQGTSEEPVTSPQAVLRHAYTGVLPDDITLLAWMIWRAGSLGMHSTAAACTAKLVELANQGQLSLADLATISTLPPMQTADSKAALALAIASMAAKVLPAHFSIARRIVVEERLQHAFVRLPFERVVQWATLPQLRLDSHNTLAVLLTAWFDHQKSAPGASNPSEQQCQGLSALLRLDKISPSFHLQALQHLKWYRAPEVLPKHHGVARVLMSIVSKVPTEWRAALDSGGAARQHREQQQHGDSAAGQQQQQGVSEAMAGRPHQKQEQQQQGEAAAEAGQRQQRVKRQKQRVQLDLSQPQLAALWEQRELPASSPIYLAGYTFQLQLLIKPVELQQEEADPADTASAAEQFTLGVYLKVDWPAILTRHGVPDSPMAGVSMSVQVRGQDKAKPLIMQCETVVSADKPRGFGDVLGASFGSKKEMGRLVGQHSIKVTLSDVQ